jgi:hypothetical protein
MRSLVILFFLGSLLLVGCASRVTSSGTAGGGKYSEDLSTWRPEAKALPVDSVVAPGTAPERIRTNQYIEPTYAVDDQIDAVLDSIYKQNLDNGFIDGYTIQVYSGIDREEALNVKKKLSKSLPNIESDVQYRQPNFRVRTGKYFSRLGAQKDYLEVKRHFPNAIVIPDRIEIQ